MHLIPGYNVHMFQYDRVCCVQITGTFECEVCGAQVKSCFVCFLFDIMSSIICMYILCPGCGNFNHDLVGHNGDWVLFILHKSFTKN